MTSGKWSGRLERKDGVWCDWAFEPEEEEKVFAGEAPVDSAGAEGVVRAREEVGDGGLAFEVRFDCLELDEDRFELVSRRPNSLRRDMPGSRCRPKVAQLACESSPLGSSVSLLGGVVRDPPSNRESKGERGDAGGSKDSSAIPSPPFISASCLAILAS